jgi:phage-related protein
MPRTLSSFGILEKNKLTSNTIWLLMLEITVPGVAEPIRITSNNENVTWRDESWIAFPFELDDMGEDSRGEVPQVSLRVSNVSRTMEAYLQDYDIYTKANGFTPIAVTIYVVNNAASFSSGVVTDTTADGAVTETTSDGALTDELYDITNPDPEAVYQYELMSPKTNSRWATFTLGASNPYNKRYPMQRMMKSHCRHRFKDVMCGYAGVGSTCDKTLYTCRTFTDSAYHDPPMSTGNSGRFGGFPGIGLRGLRLAS